MAVTAKLQERCSGYLPSLCKCAVAWLTILVEMRALGIAAVASCSSSDSSATVKVCALSLA